MYDMKNLTKLSKLGELAPEAFKAFMDFDHAVFKDGAIPVKYKELMAVAVALTTQCPYCIEIHSKNAKKAGRVPSRNWPRRPWSRQRCGPEVQSRTELTFCNKLRVATLVCQDSPPMIRQPFMSSILGISFPLRQSTIRGVMFSGIVALAAVVTHSLAVPASAEEARGASEPIAIGSRRELFIDDYLIERLEGRAEQCLQQPQPRDLALEHDAPWEGSGAAITACFKTAIATGCTTRPGIWTFRAERCARTLTRCFCATPKATTAFTGANRSWGCTIFGVRRPTTSCSRPSNSARSRPIPATSPCSRTTTPTHRPMPVTRRSFVPESRWGCWRSNRPTACIGRR